MKLTTACRYLTRICSKYTQPGHHSNESARQYSEFVNITDKLNGIPDHLKQGATIPGMRKLLKDLPADIIEEVNKQIPRDGKTGELKYARNVELNGYVNQIFIKQLSDKDGLTACQRLKLHSPEEVGVANVFVSWTLESSVEKTLDTLENYCMENTFPLNSTFFWVRDFVIKQNDVENDLKYLEQCIESIGHTIAIVEEWQKPSILSNSYCIYELHATQQYNITFDIAMHKEEEASFKNAMTYDFASIATCLAEVDISNAECRNRSEQDQIFNIIKDGVGISECNASVIRLLRESLLSIGRKELSRIDESELASSLLANNLAVMLKEIGKYEEALPLFRDGLAGYRQKYGARHPETLIWISNFGNLLCKMGNFEEALPLCKEALAGRRETLGDRHPSTLTSINNIGVLLKDMGKDTEALPLYKEALTACRETFGDRHPSTLDSINAMAVFFRDMGNYLESRRLYEEVVAAASETLGGRHLKSLLYRNGMARLIHKEGNLEESRLLFEEVLATRREVLGDQHPHTATSMKWLLEVFRESGDEDEASKLEAELSSVLH